jgi:predicted negative regulator of RcsB-dependent stress response
MASHLDLEEQEQLAQIKHFWKTYGNLISWLLIVVLGAYAAWNGYQYWQQTQSAKASALYDEVEKAVAANDLARLERGLADMKDKFASTHYAHQAGLLAARSLYAGGKVDQAQSALRWVADNAPSPALKDVARLRLSALLWESKSLDEAIKLLDAPFTPEMSGLALDLRGDVLLAQGQSAPAIEAYQKALKQLPANSDYSRMVQAKLSALGVQLAKDTVEPTVK